MLTYIYIHSIFSEPRIMIICKTAKRRLHCSCALLVCYPLRVFLRMATFSLAGKALKLDSAEDIKPHLGHLDSDKVEHIVLSGNTVGVAASQALAERVRQCHQLKVTSSPQTK